MIRASIGEKKYWNTWIEKDVLWLKDVSEKSALPSKNTIYRPEYVWGSATDQCRLMLRLYSSGAPIRDLAQHFPGLLDAWVLSNRLSDEVCKENDLQTCRDWDFSLTNLNHYNWCFWLVGLALALEISEDQWQRLLALVGGEGEDELLDRVIASRTPGRRIGAALLHAKPYARLLKAVNTPLDVQAAQTLTQRLGIKPYSLNYSPNAVPGDQAALLLSFVDHWYAELKRPAPKNKKAPTLEPFWYIYGDPEKHPLEMGSYFGRWCIEAVAAVKAFGLDDSLCLGHEHYPGDLLRPDGPSTHPVREEPKTGWLARMFGKKTS